MCISLTSLLSHVLLEDLRVDRHATKAAAASTTLLPPQRARTASTVISKKMLAHPQLSTTLSVRQLTACTETPEGSTPVAKHSNYSTKTSFDLLLTRPRSFAFTASASALRTAYQHQTLFSEDMSMTDQSSQAVSICRSSLNMSKPSQGTGRLGRLGGAR